MKLTLETTPEQDTTLASINTESNINGIEPSPEEFTISVINDYLNSLVSKNKQFMITKAAEKLPLLSDEELKAILDK